MDSKARKVCITNSRRRPVDLLLQAGSRSQQYRESLFGWPCPLIQPCDTTPTVSSNYMSRSILYISTRDKGPCLHSQDIATEHIAAGKIKHFWLEKPRISESSPIESPAIFCASCRLNAEMQQVQRFCLHHPSTFNTSLANIDRVPRGLKSARKNTSQTKALGRLLDSLFGLVSYYSTSIPTIRSYRIRNMPEMAFCSKRQHSLHLHVWHVAVHPQHQIHKVTQSFTEPGSLYSFCPK